MCMQYNYINRSTIMSPMLSLSDDIIVIILNMLTSNNTLANMFSKCCGIAAKGGGLNFKLDAPIGFAITKNFFLSTT